MRLPLLPSLPRNLQPANISSLLHLLRIAMSGNNSPAPPHPIKILMLHGFTQSGPLFRAKTRALEKNLQKAFPAGVSLSYPTAPIKLSPVDIPFAIPATSAKNANEGGGEEENDTPDLNAWAWWTKKGDTEPYTYEGIELGLARIAEVCKAEGPFDGVIGFSQGGAMAALVASVLEPGRRQIFQKLHQKDGGMRWPDVLGTGDEVIHPPLKFAVSYSGFAALGTGDLYRAFYEPKITTPVLHFLGTLDTTVDEKRSLALVDACQNSDGRVVYHPGGHFVPSSQKAYVGALIGFIKEVLHSAAAGNQKEESVEDMDVPF